MRQGSRRAARPAVQRARLERAEAATFEHFGVQVESERLDLRDPRTTVRVVRCGQGPPVLLLHGASMTAAVWAPLLPYLQGRSLHLVDLPGCGLSDPFDYTGLDITAHMEAFVGSVLDGLGLPRAPLVGSSLGGMFALRFALRAPARVSALALVSAPAVALAGARVPLTMALGSTRLGHAVTLMGPPPSARMTRRILATLGGDGAPPDAPERYYDALGAAASIAAPTNASLTPRLFRWRTPHPAVSVTDGELAACQAPVLLVWGDDDPVQPASAAFRAAEILPDARVEVLPGGHGIWVDQPARCGALITGFLDEMDERAARPPGRA